MKSKLFAIVILGQFFFVVLYSLNLHTKEFL